MERIIELSDIIMIHWRILSVSGDSLEDYLDKCMRESDLED